MTAACSVTNIAGHETNVPVPVAPSTGSRLVTNGNLFLCVSAASDGLRKRNELR